MNTDYLTELPYPMRCVTPHLTCDGVADAIEFYRKAFGAEEINRLPGPDGRIMHATIALGDSAVMLVDENLERGARGPHALGGTPVTIHLTVKNADAFEATAKEAGATVLMPVAEQFWGDRYGLLEDPFGHHWAVDTPGEPKSMEEMQEAMKALAG
jgi:PhnB protein